MKQLQLLTYNLLFLVLTAQLVQAEKTSDTAQEPNPLSSLIDSLIEQTSNELSLNESDYRTIRRQGNVFLVPAALRQKALLSIPSFSNQGSVRRIRSGDKILGFRIESLSKNGLFPHLGFSTGDLIRSVNGHALQSETDALALIAQLSNSEQIHIDFERGPKRSPQRFYYRLVG
jgi:S1-C subfamily serine protease